MRQAFRNAFYRSVLNRATPYQKTDLKENAKELKTHFREIGETVRNHVRDNYNPKDPFFMKDPQGRNINNLWTGYKLGGKGNLLAAGSILGGGTIIATNPRHYQSLYNQAYYIPAMSEELDVESLPSTRADGVGYQAAIGNNPMLTTSGDLVFAMHKTRHTGQF